MNTTPATSFSSRSAGLPSGPWLVVLFCWLALVLAIVAPIPAQATLSDYAKASKVIAPRLTAQVPFGEPVKLEIAARFFGGNDPINRHDPLGLDPWGHSWGIYKPAWWESVVGYLAPSYVDAKRHRAWNEGFGVPVTDNGSADIQSAWRQYAYDVDHDIDTSSIRYQERFRASINGGLEKQYAAAQFGLAEAQPGLLAIEAFLALAPSGAEFMEAKSPGLSGVFGSRIIAAEGTDFMAGRLGGELYDVGKLSQLERYLGRRRITLQVGDEFLPAGKAGGFNAIEGTLSLRSNPTEYEVWHELSHFRQFRLLGPDAYNGLSRVQKEQFVFDLLENSPRRWNTLNFDQQQHAIDYIERVGGFR